MIWEYSQNLIRISRRGEVAKLRASTILKGRVDDRDLDFGLALADQLDRELHAEMHAVHAARKEIARKIAACRSRCVPDYPCMQENCCVPTCGMHAVHAAAHVQTKDGRDGQEDGGVQERDAADFEDGGVGRGRGVRRQVREGGERHAADLEDVVERDDDDEDGIVVAGREDAFVSKGFAFWVIYLEFLTLSKGQIQLFLSRAWIDEIAALGSS